MTRPLDNRVYNLASKLFGSTSVDSNIDLPPIPAPASERCIMAVYPAIIQEAFSQTMDSYRLYVNAYNFKTKAENKEIVKYNNDIDQALANGVVSDEQRTAIQYFMAAYHDEYARDYNDQAERFNARYGLIIRKRKIPTVKYSTELVFQNLLSLYNAQLMRRNEEYMRFRIVTPRPLQEFDINSHLVAKMKRNGINALDLCKRSVRNHRQRLEECGILTDYRYHGQARAVSVQINPDILAVLDLKTTKIVTAQNQPVSPTKWKELPDADDNTRTIIKEYQRNADAGSPPDKEFAPLTRFDLSFYGNTTGKVQNPGGPPPPQNVKVPPGGRDDIAQPETTAPAGPPTLSQKLAALVIHPQELAERLTAGEFFNYTFIPIGALSREAFAGTLTNEEFRELVIQDFFKGASDIWRGSTPFIGSWKKAINLYYANKFISFRDTALNKSTIIDDIQELRWCIASARRWFLNNQFNPLFPSDYFDMTRKQKGEVGFEYVRTVLYPKHKKQLEQDEIRKKKAAAKAEARKKRLNHAKKCEQEVKRFLKDKITLPELINYVERNLPPEFAQQLPSIIERHRNPRPRPPKNLQINDR